MKNLSFISFFLLFLSNLYSQNSDIDKIINDYEQKYRIELNESDFKLIDSISNVIETEGCVYLNKLIETKSVSSAILDSIIKNLVNKEICFLEILENVDLFIFNPEATSPLDPINYPVYSLLVHNSKYDEVFIEYLVQSNYLNDCEFLIKKKEKRLTYIKLIFKREIRSKKDSVTTGSNLSSCKTANLMILQNQSK